MTKRRINGREFDNDVDANAYQNGYRSYPRWPRIGMNSSAIDAPQDSWEATGWYDAENEEQERLDRK